MKKAILNTMALLSVITLTACSSNTESNSATSSTTPAQSSLVSTSSVSSVSSVSSTSSALSASTEGSNEDKKNEKFEISQEVFDEAVEQVKETLKYEAVYEDSQFILKEDSIVFVVRVNSATTKEKAKDIADTAVRQLSAWLSYSYDELKSPGADDFGNLPEYYSITLGVGSDEKNMMVTKTIASYNNNGKI